MIKRVGFPVCLALALVFGCENDDSPNEEPKLEQLKANTLEPDPNFVTCDSAAMAISPGTTCCISGPVVAKPGDIVRYHYQMNHSDERATWEILEGDISIIAGQGTQTVTVRFGPNFTTGIVHADGDGLHKSIIPVRNRCEDRVNVRNN